jgi:hypothetical protein
MGYGYPCQNCVVTEQLLEYLEQRAGMDFTEDIWKAMNRLIDELDSAVASNYELHQEDPTWDHKL